MSDVEAYVERTPDGHLVLRDPAAEGMIAAVEAHNIGIARVNCRRLLTENVERVRHFQGRAAVLGKTAADAVIVILSVDDEHGGMLTEVLMPRQEALWRSFRDRGQMPFARGLAKRAGIMDALALFAPRAASDLRHISELAVVVVAFGTALVAPASAV